MNGIFNDYMKALESMAKSFKIPLDELKKNRVVILPRSFIIDNGHTLIYDFESPVSLIQGDYVSVSIRNVYHSDDGKNILVEDDDDDVMYALMSEKEQVLVDKVTL